MVARNTPGACGRKLGAWDLALETWRLGPGVCGPGPTRRPGLLFVARAAQYAADDILREAAAGQEARLLGIGRAVGRLSPKRLRQTSSARSCSVDRSWSRNSATWPSSTPCWRSSCTMRAAPGATRADARGSARNARWTASLPFPARPAPPRSRPDLRHEAPACGQFGARMLAARQIAHGAHLQRRPLALRLARHRPAHRPPSCRGPSDRCPLHRRPARRGRPRDPPGSGARRRALLGRALPFVRRGGGLGGAARVGAAAQALRLGHGLELVIQLGAQMLGGWRKVSSSWHEV